MCNLTLKQLRMFCRGDSDRSISAAAEALSVTRPAVALQDMAGVPLIGRAPAGMVPTDAGRRVIDAADRIEAVLADCTATLAGFSGARTGTVAVASSAPRNISRRAPLPLSHRRIRDRAAPSIGNRADIMEGLRRYELDLAVMGRPPQELDVVLELIGDHPHVIVTRPDHALAGVDRVVVEALAKETFLVREPGSGTRD